jgi:hypothetical protein
MGPRCTAEYRGPEGRTRCCFLHEPKHDWHKGLVGGREVWWDGSDEHHATVLPDGEKSDVMPYTTHRVPATTVVSRREYYGGADNPYEAIKVIRAWCLGFNLGNVVKYISRLGKKPGADRLADLIKMKQYIEFEIEEELARRGTPMR